MSSKNCFQGSIFNVSPLCQDCKLIMFAHQNGIMFHECEVCKNKYQEMLAHKDATCGDNRLELIAKYKQQLIEGTNIENSPDEMAVIDNILFRFWQMGWLDILEKHELIEV